MEKSTKTKLIILFGLIVAVLLFVFVMYSQITVIEDVELTTSSFQDEIVIEIKEMIPDDTKCRTYARTQYEQIVDEIMTETLLGKLDKSVEDSCILVANKAIVTNIDNVSNYIMRSGNWSNVILNTVESNCKFALSKNSATESQKKQLNTYINTIGQYRKAIVVCEASHRYNGEEANKSLIEEANSYLSDTSLHPCKDLISNLHEVKNNLYNAHLAYVKSVRTNEACDGFLNMASVYGRNKEEMKNAISTITSEILQKEKRQAVVEVESFVNDVNEHDW